MKSRKSRPCERDRGSSPTLVSSACLQGAGCGPITSGIVLMVGDCFHHRQNAMIIASTRCFSLSFSIIVAVLSFQDF